MHGTGEPNTPCSQGFQKKISPLHAHDVAKEFAAVNMNQKHSIITK